MKKIYLLGLSVLALSIASLPAAVLSSFTFTGSTRTSSDTDLDSVTGPILDGAGLTVGSFIDTTRGNPSPSLAIVSTDTDGTTQGAAVTANDYISFTITPNAGFVFNLTSLTFDYANYSNDATFPSETFFVRSSQDSFASNIAAAVTASPASAGTFTNSNISLTGAAFQNVSVPIEFRIYFSDGTTNANRGALVDNITLNGTLALVPEPSTYMLIGLGALICAQQYRRRKGA